MRSNDWPTWALAVVINLLMAGFLIAGWEWPLLVFGVGAITISCFFAATIYVLPQAPDLHVMLLRTRLPNDYLFTGMTSMSGFYVTTLAFHGKFSVVALYVIAQALAIWLYNNIRRRSLQIERNIK